MTWLGRDWRGTVGAEAGAEAARAEEAQNSAGIRAGLDAFEFCSSVLIAVSKADTATNGRLSGAAGWRGSRPPATPPPVTEILFWPQLTGARAKTSPF